MRELLKSMTRWAALILVSPELVSYWLRSTILGKDRALEGSTQLLATIPGLLGQYLRRAFLGRVIAHCHPSATVEFGVILSKVDACIDENVYVGAYCQLGLVHLQRDVMLAGGVHIPSGPNTHGIGDGDRPFRDQAGERKLITIGAGSWVGSAAVVLADVGAHSVIGAGAVVTKPIPDRALAAGVPAEVVKSLSEGHP